MAVTPDFFLRCAIKPALDLLPVKMDSDGGKSMVLAIALQESGLEHRRQIGGPARGYCQFEVSGVRGVLAHPASKPHILHVLKALDYDGVGVPECYEIIEDNDVVAAAFARLLLWTLPDPLPNAGEYDESWRQYIQCWRPGKPHRETWDQCYTTAWATVRR